MTLDDTLRAYIECALWSSLDDDGEPLDGPYSADDLAPETLATMRDDVLDFCVSIAREGYDRSAWTDEQLGHDFWLTRNRHGAGFWDRGHGEPGEILTRAAHAYGEQDLYVADDGRIHV